MRLLRDVDSVIGTSRDLPFTTSIAIFPVPSFVDTLKKNNKVTVAIDHQVSPLVPRSYFSSEVSSTLQGQRIRVPMHEIPNFPFCKIQNRHITRLFLPALYEHGGNPIITPALFADFYDHHLRPAVQAVMPEVEGHWPVSYSAAMTQLRTRKGTLTTSSQDWPADKLEQFGTDLIGRLDASRATFHGAFFGHELRGTKGQAPHDATDANERTRVTDEFFQFLNMEAIVLDDWKMDIGLEISSRDDCLLWKAMGHWRVLRHVMPGLSQAGVDALMRTRRFKVYPCSSLYDLSGFAVEPHRHGQADHVSYVQAYTTDKTVTYTLHQSIWSARMADCLLPQHIDKLKRDLVEMASIFLLCARRKHSVAARVEVRVPISHATTALTSFPRELINASITACSPAKWW